MLYWGVRGEIAARQRTGLTSVCRTKFRIPRAQIKKFNLCLLLAPPSGHQQADLRGIGFSYAQFPRRLLAVIGLEDIIGRPVALYGLA
ncbi:MAG: hypothetical protein LKJ88_02640 [Bacilli bacterium]|nr:hypothetical protein [Bacilli bacterium]